VLVTAADVMENLPFLDMLWRAGFRWQLRKEECDRRHNQWHSRDYSCALRCRHPGLCANNQLGQAQVLVWPRGL